MARIHQRHPNSVECFLTHSALCVNTDEVPQVDSAELGQSEVVDAKSLIFLISGICTGKFKMLNDRTDDAVAY
jgi:hypothetical protein